jgi:hypothetical protein
MFYQIPKTKKGEGMRMKSSNWYVTAAVIAILSLVSTGCGGGGGGGGGGGSSFPGFTPAATTTAMTTTQAHGVKTTGLATFAHTVGSMAGATGGGSMPLGAPARQSEGPVGSNLLQNLVQGIVTQVPMGTYHASGTATGSDSCTYSGNMQASLQWEGADQVASYCELVNLSGTITLTNCELDQGITQNGEMFVQFSGPFCEPTSLQINLTNYTYNEPGNTIQTRSLSVNVHDLTWSGQLPNGTLTAGTSVMSGQAVGTIDGDSFAAAFDNYFETFEQTSASQYSMVVSGGITGPCLDGWAEISTSAPIIVNDAQACPIAGQILIEGNGSPMDVIFYSDGSVDVNDVTYESCEDMDLNCPTP